MQSNGAGDALVAQRCLPPYIVVDNAVQCAVFSVQRVCVTDLESWRTPL